MVTLFTQWLEENSQPDELETGGTIVMRVDSKTGTRVTDKAPNMGTGIVRTLRTGTIPIKRIVVYPEIPTLDSSNQTPKTQATFLDTLGKAVIRDLKAIKEKRIILGTPGNYIPAEEISIYYDFPHPSGPGLYASHGTDTLDEDASLSAYLMLPKVMGITGSYATEEEPGTDAVTNKKNAEELAKNVSVPIGTYVIIGREIHLATRVKKINTKPWKPDGETPYSSKKPWRKPGPASYFASIDDRPVGYFDEQGKIFFDTAFLDEWEKILAKRSQDIHVNDFFPSYGFKPTYVEHINIDKSTPKNVFNNLVKRLESKGKGSGAVIEGNLYAHRYYKAFKQEIEELASKGIFIIETEQKKPMKDASEGCDFILPSQLRIKLSALLARDKGRDLFTRTDLWENYAGEVMDRELIQQNTLHIPKAFYETGEFITIFPGIEPDVLTDATQRLRNKKIPQGKQPVLLLNGYGDGHLPIGVMTMEERLRKGFEAFDPKLGEQLLQAIQTSKTPSYTIDSLLTQLTKILNNNRESAQTQLRKALTNSDEMLKALSNASDEGIRVLIGSKAEYAVPDPNAYEIGTILALIGVKTLKKPTRVYLNELTP